MPIEITLPRQGWSMEEAAFVEWLKKNGETVKAGEPLFSVETDKAVQEIESLDAGILRIPPDWPNKGDMVHVGDVIGYLAQAGEAVSFDGLARAKAPTGAPKTEVRKDAISPGVSPIRTMAARPETDDTPHEPRWPRQRGLTREVVPPPPRTVVSPISGGAGSVPTATRAARAAPPVTPRAAKRALRGGVDLRTVKGSGAGGRIRERDVAVPPPEPFSAPMTASDRAIPVSGLRRTIAERMGRSRAATAPVTLTTKVDATALVGWREPFKADASPDNPAPAYTDFIIKLLAQALAEHPLLNARWEETRIVLSGAINIGLAVDTEDGLLVPVVRDVAGLTLRQVAARTRDLAERARQRRLTAEDLTGGTFTVTNLGALGVDAFTPIINHPECAVLGVGRICREPAVVDGQIVIRDRVWLSLTFDHRIVDGAPAARFLDTLRGAVESPAARLME